MSQLDIVIFGATGFTGKNTVIECAKIAKTRFLNWGIAGRTRSKLVAVLEEASKRTGEDLSSIPVIIARVDDDDSLRDMCEKARVVVNCCGPFRLYGEPVVAAAVNAKANYVDVSGEPQFMETMKLRYDAQAREAGVYVISACGFDSIPNDMGVIFLEQNFDGTLNSVESYVSAHVSPECSWAAQQGGVVHFGTWASIVHGVAHRNELKSIREQLYPDELPTFQPELKKRWIVHRRDGHWCLPFPGADSSVVYRTQRELYERDGKRPVQFHAYTKVPGLFVAIWATIVGFFMLLLSYSTCTRRWLFNYPRLFSLGAVTKEDVKEEVMENTHFSVELYGSGWRKGANLETTPPNKTMAVKVSGRNPGYGATVVALLHSAIIILEQCDKMPKPCGVMTSGLAFQNTDLIQRLQQNNLKFEIIND